METTTRKIGRNKGKSRLWIEGAALIKAGFAHGQEWQLIGDGSLEHGLTLQTSDAFEVEGVRVRRVSGSASRPVIDIAGSSLGHLGTLESVALHFEAGSGAIAVRPNECRNA